MLYPMKYFAPLSTPYCSFLGATSSSSVMVDVPGPFPIDPLLTLTLSELCLQGAHNEENIKLNTRPLEHIIKPFSIRLLSIKAEENTAARLLRTQSHSFWWDAQVSTV